LASVELKSIKKKFGDVEIIHNLDLRIEPGEFTVFVGPSGCGKSTLLRMIAGLEEITEGDLDVYTVEVGAGLYLRVTLNYQSIPPYYLKQRFAIGRGPETQRLAYLTSHLTVEGTPAEGWKLPLVCATRRIDASTSSACGVK